MRAIWRHVERVLGRHRAEPVQADASLARVVLAWSKRGRCHREWILHGIILIFAEAGVAMGSRLHVEN